MRKALLIIALMLLLSFASVAKPDYILIPSTNGTYNVSFDLGDNINYQKHIEDTESNEAYTGVKFTCNKIRLDLIHDEGIYIMLCEYDVPVVATPEANKQFVADFFKGIYIYNPFIYDRVIDGLPGVIGVGSGGTSTLYFAQYWPIGLCFKPEKCMGFISCEIRSLCSWDTTKNLLNTIHVDTGWINETTPKEA